MDKLFKQIRCKEENFKSMIKEFHFISFNVDVKVYVTEDVICEKSKECFYIENMKILSMNVRCFEK